MQLQRPCRAALVVFALLALLPAAAALKHPAGGKPEAATSAADVAKLHKKLEAVAHGLESVVSKEQDGGLANSKVAPTLKAFLRELHATLNATAAPTPKDAPAALVRLQAAQAGMAELTKALNKQQESLMHEDDDQSMSLLLGVLMTRRGEPFEKQLEILRSPDFSGLPVSKELLATQDKATPLFQQVAQYMDKHGSKGEAVALGPKDRLAKTAAYFSQRVETLKEQATRLQKVHDLSQKRLGDMIKTGAKESTHKYELMKRQSEHDFKKRMAANANQVKEMDGIVAALKRGDVDALKRAQAALKASVKAMQQQSGGFLHLLQLGSRLAAQDCPYCAAQCIEKCHTAGMPYTQCLTTCADAGK